MPQTADSAAFWNRLRREAQRIAKEEPLLAPLMRRTILDRADFPECLAEVLSSRLRRAEDVDRRGLSDLFSATIAANPSIASNASVDLMAAVDRDPALETLCETMLFGKGFHALQIHRIAHALWKSGARMSAKLLQSAAAERYGVDIHPAAVVGHGVQIDHATGLVIGETARVGNDVSIFHGLTLGGTGKETGDRHPKVGDGVLLSAHAQLLGNIRIGRGAKIGAGAVVLTDVPPHTTFAGVPAVKVGVPDCDAPGLEMDVDFLDPA